MAVTLQSSIPQPLETIVYFLSLWICQFRTFRVNRKICVTFFIWLLLYLSGFVCLFSVRLSSLMHIIACNSSPFFFMCHLILSIHQLTDICFVSTLVLLWRILSQTFIVKFLAGHVFSFLLCIFLDVDLLGPVVAPEFQFLRNFQTIFHSDCTILYSHHQSRRFPRPPPPHQHLLIVHLFDDPLSSGCDWISHCGFDLNFTNDNGVEHFCVCFLDICISSSEKYLFKPFTSF